MDLWDESFEEAVQYFGKRLVEREQKHEERREKEHQQEQEQEKPSSDLQGRRSH